MMENSLKWKLLRITKKYSTKSIVLVLTRSSTVCIKSISEMNSRTKLLSISKLSAYSNRKTISKEKQLIRSEIHYQICMISLETENLFYCSQKHKHEK